MISTSCPTPSRPSSRRASTRCRVTIARCSVTRPCSVATSRSRCWPRWSISRRSAWPTTSVASPTSSRPRPPATCDSVTCSSAMSPTKVSRFGRAGRAPPSGADPRAVERRRRRARRAALDPLPPRRQLPRVVAVLARRGRAGRAQRRADRGCRLLPERARGRSPPRRPRCRLRVRSRGEPGRLPRAERPLRAGPGGVRPGSAFSAADPSAAGRLCRKIGWVRDHEGRYSEAQRWFQSRSS